jgi:hypothetical protein
VVQKAFAALFMWGKLLGATVADAFDGVFKFFKMLGAIVSDAFKATIAFWSNLAGIVKAAWSVVIDFFKNIFKGDIEAAFGGVFAFFQELPALFLEAFSPIVEFYEMTFGRLILWFEESFLGFYERTFGRLVVFFQEGLLPIFAQIFEGFNILWQGVKQIFDGIINGYRIVFETAKRIFAGIINGYKIVFDNAKKILMGVMEVYKNGFQAIGTLLTETFTSIKNGLTGWINFVNTTFKKILSGYVAWINNVNKTFMRWASILIKPLARAFNTIKMPIVRFWQALGKVIPPFKQLANALNNFDPGSVGGKDGKIGGTTGQVTEGLKSAFSLANERRPTITEINREAVDIDIDLSQPFASFNNRAAKAALRPAFEVAKERLKEITGAKDIIANTLQGMEEVIGEVKRFDSELRATNQGILSFGGSDATGFRNLKEEREAQEALDNMPERAQGGPVGGGPAMLHPGEFVLRQSAVDSIGQSQAAFINRTGRLPRGDAQKTQNVTIVFEPGSISMQGVSDPDRFVDELIDTMKRRGIDGDFVMSSSGLRETS